MCATKSSPVTCLGWTSDGRGQVHLKRLTSLVALLQPIDQPEKIQVEKSRTAGNAGALGQIGYGKHFRSVGNHMTPLADQRI